MVNVQHINLQSIQVHATISGRSRTENRVISRPKQGTDRRDKMSGIVPDNLFREKHERIKPRSIKIAANACSKHFRTAHLTGPD